jgi:hypothetical protein
VEPIYKDGDSKKVAAEKDVDTRTKESETSSQVVEEKKDDNGSHDAALNTAVDDK